MTRPAARPPWYRVRVTIRRRVAGYLALAILVGLIAAVAALVLANLVAALPGLRTPAEVLRAE